jgi:hypothetical protein
MTPQTKVWLKGLLAANIGGAANGITVVIVAPETFNLHDGIFKLLSVMASSAIVSGALYLKQSPLPDIPSNPTITPKT